MYNVFINEHNLLACIPHSFFTSLITSRISAVHFLGVGILCNLEEANSTDDFCGHIGLSLHAILSVIANL